MHIEAGVWCVCVCVCMFVCVHVWVCMFMYGVCTCGVRVPCMYVHVIFVRACKYCTVCVFSCV